MIYRRKKTGTNESQAPKDNIQTKLLYRKQVILCCQQNITALQCCSKHKIQQDLPHKTGRDMGLDQRLN